MTTLFFGPKAWMTSHQPDPMPASRRGCPRRHSEARRTHKNVQEKKRQWSRTEAVLVLPASQRAGFPQEAGLQNEGLWGLQPLRTSQHTIFFFLIQWGNKKRLTNRESQSQLVGEGLTVATKRQCLGRKCFYRWTLNPNAEQCRQ